MDEKNVTSTKQKKDTTIPYILQGEFFEILRREGNSVTVQCRKCTEKNYYKGTLKSTGNFHMHIKRKHPDSLGRLQELKLKSFLEKKIKIPERFKNHLFLTVKNGNVNNKNNNAVISNILSSEPGTSSVIQNCEIFKYNNQQPINCCKKPKIIKDEQICEAKIALNMEDSLTKQNNDYILNTKNMPILSKSIKSNNVKVTSTSTCTDHQNFTTTEQGKSLNNFYSFPQNLNISHSMISTTPTSQDQNCSFLQNATNNNNCSANATATLTATSMMLSPTQELLGKMNLHLKSIEKQLNVRNQIETNRIYLDLAKFKYLHPNFASHG